MRYKMEFYKMSDIFPTALLNIFYKDNDPHKTNNLETDDQIIKIKKHKLSNSFSNSKKKSLKTLKNIKFETELDKIIYAANTRGLETLLNEKEWAIFHIRKNSNLMYTCAYLPQKP